MDLAGGLPVWHVSLSRPRLSPVASWTASERRMVEQTATALLRDRGEGESYWTEGTIVLHLRRRLTAEEQALLPVGWMLIPACDRG